MTSTDRQSATVDRDAFTVRRTILIAAPIDRVWAAITEPQHIARWFGQAAVLDELAVGARGVFSFDGHGDFPVRIEEVDAPHSIAYRWGNEAGHALDARHIDDAHSTVFRFTLAAAPTGTELTVVESGFESLADPDEGMESNRGGWDFELDELIAYLEGDA